MREKGASKSLSPSSPKGRGKKVKTVAVKKDGEENSSLDLPSEESNSLSSQSQSSNENQSAQTSKSSTFDPALGQESKSSRKRSTRPSTIQTEEGEEEPKSKRHRP